MGNPLPKWRENGKREQERGIRSRNGRKRQNGSGIGESAPGEGVSGQGWSPGSPRAEDRTGARESEGVAQPAGAHREGHHPAGGTQPREGAGRTAGGTQRRGRDTAPREGRSAAGGTQRRGRDTAPRGHRTRSGRDTAPRGCDEGLRRGGCDAGAATRGPRRGR